MSKVESPFNIDNKAEFRFSLTLESRSVEAHSLMDSGKTKEDMKNIMDSIVRNPKFKTTLERHLVDWKEKHK